MFASQKPRLACKAGLSLQQDRARVWQVSLFMTGLLVLFAWGLASLGGPTEPVPSTEAKSFHVRRLAILRAGRFHADKIIKPRAAALKVMAGEEKATANFDVTYHNFPADAKNAFQGAVNVWGALLTTPVKVRVDAYWQPLGANILGSAGPSVYFRNFGNAPKTNTFYPVALANKLATDDLYPGKPHIVANFSSSFPNWYFGTDSNTPADKYDLMSVVLHELGHGLGFIGSMDVGNDGQGRWGLDSPPLPIIFDTFTENESGKKLLDTTAFPNPSIALAGELTSNHLYFNGTNAVAANGNQRVRLYAPLTWEEGSSYSHLDETTFPAGNPNSLMTPQLGLGEAIHDPGPVGMGVLKDIGW